MQPGFDVSVIIGPHNKERRRDPETYIKNDNTDDPRMLYNPLLGHRCEAEVNDLSYSTDDYPPEWEGPDLWVDMKVPEGIHCVSLYFTNNDEQSPGGDDLDNKFRDYDVQLLTVG